MIIFLDAQGNIVTTSAPEPIGRNSNNANIIYIVAPFSSAANIYMTFTLPNGETLFGNLLDPTDREDLIQAAYLFTLPDSAVSAWRYLTPSSVTRLSGAVQYTIVTVTESMRATASGTFTVARGNRLILPEAPTPEVWNDLLQRLSYKNAEIDNGLALIENLHSSITKIEGDLISLYGTSLSVETHDADDNSIILRLKNRSGEVISEEYIDPPVKKIVSEMIKDAITTTLNTEV